MNKQPLSQRIANFKLMGCGCSALIIAAVVAGLIFFSLVSLILYLTFYGAPPE